jgi:2-dehydro-3-deoxygluconokinase
MTMADTASHRILAIGEPMIELSSIDPTKGQAAFGFAGDTLNTAVYLARALSNGVGSVDYLTVLGKDTLSDAMLAWMEGEGIGTARVARHPSLLPGIYAIEVNKAGERSFRYWRDRSAARTLFEDGTGVETALSGADVIYLSGITLAILSDPARDALIAACHAARDAGRRVVFDSNYRPALWASPDRARDIFHRMWAATSIALPSADDEQALHPRETADQTGARIAGYGVPEIVVKRGPAGPAIWHAGQWTDLALPPSDDVRDTTAAGDSFNAGYLAARLGGAPPGDAARAGHALACRVIAHKGAILPR